MQKIGIIGLGTIAGCHVNSFRRLDGAEIVAVCDQCPGRAEELGLTDARLYTDYRDLLADPEVEAVDILLPTFLHTEVVVAALEAGKHVLCEKPMALTVEECDLMLQAAQRTGRTLMLAHVIRFWPEYVALKQIVDSGRYGKVTSAYFSRMFAAPKNHPAWFGDPSRSGGATLDLHIHDADYVTYLLGYPQSVFAVGGDHNAQALYRFANGSSACAEGGWDYHDGFQGGMTFRVRLEGATIVWNAATPLTVYPACGESYQPELPAMDGYTAEIAYFIDCLDRGAQPEIITAQQARDTIRLIHAEKESILTGKAVEL